MADRGGSVMPLCWPTHPGLEELEWFYCPHGDEMARDVSGGTPFKGLESHQGIRDGRFRRTVLASRQPQRLNCSQPGRMHYCCAVSNVESRFFNQSGHRPDVV